MLPDICSMKTLSLLQPWASLVMMGAKCFEVRSWSTAYRGPMLIHASAGKPLRREKMFFEQSEHFNRYITDMNLLPYGCIIGQVNLNQVVATEWLVQHFELFPEVSWKEELAFDDYSARRFAWQLSDPRPLEYFIPIKGRLGLWEY